MRLTNGILKVISKEIKEKYINNFLVGITLISKKDILFSFSFNKKDYLYISLDSLNPYIYFSNEIKKINTYPCTTNEILRKELDGAYLFDVTQINEDRVLCFSFKKKNEYFENKILKLILEFIPSRTNLILLNDDGKIIYALNYSPITSSRPLLKNSEYIILNNNVNFIKPSAEEILNYKKEILPMYFKALERRKDEQFKPLLTKIKGKIKNLKRRKEILILDKKEALEKLNYIEIANNLLTFQNDKDILNNYIVNNLKGIYDDEISLIDNVNYLFKKYKKSKTAIEIDEKEIALVDKQLDKCENILNSFQYLDEDDLLEINDEMHLLIKNKNNHQIKKEKKILFSYITYKGYKIAFGKSAKQNDALTFHFAKKEFTYFHLANEFASHVVFLKNELNEDDIEFAAKICLLLAKKEDGEVFYTKIKNVKKSSQLGLAILKEYKSIYIRNIDESARLALLQMKRYMN